MTAQIKAVRYAVTHRDETIALTREAIGAKPDDPRPAFVYEEGLKPGVVDADFSIPLESLIWSQEQMIALGQLAKGGDINKLIYPDIRKEALARSSTQVTRYFASSLSGLTRQSISFTKTFSRRDGPAVARGRPNRMGEDVGSR